MPEASCHTQSKKPMSRLVKLLFASALVAAAIVSGLPKTATAAGFCSTCAADPNNCFACCKCDGGSTGACLAACGYP